MRKFIAYFTCLVFLAQISFFPLVSHAQDLESSTSENERVTTLSLGESAPFAGTLFSTEATARMLAELELSRESCDLRVSRAVEENQASCQLQIDRLRITSETNQEIFNSRLEIKNGQISFLQERYEPPSWFEHPAFWITVGLVVGAGATIGVTYAVNTP